ncbi:MAG: class I SAM-dependent methyltransferase [Deltaproteobacteria bacterium]|nr:class I SAM-dependent methyltransferase [Deltaproteobacteria bacterium]
MPAWVVIALTIIATVFVVTFLLSFSIVVVHPITKGAMFHPSARIRVRTFLDNVPMKEGELLIDPGCGDGRVLREASKRYKVRALGFEINPLAYLLARLGTLGKRDVRVRFKNFWKVNFSDADLVFCYLFPDVMKRLEQKLEGELQPGCRIVSCNFPFPGWKYERIVRPDSSLYGDPIYLYRFPECLDS